MMTIDAKSVHFQTLNDQIRRSTDSQIKLENVLGQRYIASGLTGRRIDIHGTPGNALAAYCDGCDINVYGNAQDALCDTMNDGNVVIYGSAGDTVGYGMRGGKIFIRDTVGYRAGIHMKAYQDKIPVVVIGKSAGSFLGEYQAGGTIIVLGLGQEGIPVGGFCGTGMHGGRMFVRTDKMPEDLPKQIVSRVATPEDLKVIRADVEQFCKYFGENAERVMDHKFYLLTPNSANPYRQMYTYI
jgi:glutamate synthase domain-containing protein 3